MADLTDIQAAAVVKVVGSDATGAETNTQAVSTLNEAQVADILNNGGLDIVLSLTTTASEGKVGVSRKTNRKYVIMEALTANVKWGFSNTTQSFDLFKSQLIMVPVGDQTQIWFKMSAGTGTVAFAEC